MSPAASTSLPLTADPDGDLDDRIEVALAEDRISTTHLCRIPNLAVLRGRRLLGRGQFWGPAMESGALDGTQATSWEVITGTYRSVRSRSTDFGQVGFEPGPAPTALKPAFYLGFCVPY